MIIFTKSSDLDPDRILFSDPDPLKQIISYPGGSRSGTGSTTLIIRLLFFSLCSFAMFSVFFFLSQIQGCPVQVFFLSKQ
jgi:hypothetical protein